MRGLTASEYSAMMRCFDRSADLHVPTPDEERAVEALVAQGRMGIYENDEFRIAYLTDDGRLMIRIYEAMRST
jgi:hypothetical protein